MFSKFRSGWPGIRKLLVWSQTLWLNSLHGLSMSDIRNRHARPQTLSYGVRMPWGAWSRTNQRCPLFLMHWLFITYFTKILDTARWFFLPRSSTRLFDIVKNKWLQNPTRRLCPYDPSPLCSTIIVLMSAPSTTRYLPFDSNAPTVFKNVQRNNYIASKSFLLSGKL
jgi:hypothetical protein